MRLSQLETLSTYLSAVSSEQPPLASAIPPNPKEAESSANDQPMGGSRVSVVLLAPSETNSRRPSN